MRVYHYRLLICGEKSFATLRQALAQLVYEPGNQRGFIPALDAGFSRLAGRMVYTRLGKRVALDAKTLEPTEALVETLADLRFELDRLKGLAMVERRRGDFSVLYEALDAIPDVQVTLEDLNLNLQALLEDLQGAYKKNTVKTLRIQDYLARENMLATASFKILEEPDADKIAEKFNDQLAAFTLGLKLPDGAASITVTRNGTVRVSDGMPDDVLAFVKDLLPRFHEAEVETAEVTAPK